MTVPTGQARKPSCWTCHHSVQRQRETRVFYHRAQVYKHQPPVVPHPALWWHRGSFSRPAALQGCRGWALGLGPPPRAEVSPLWMPQEADAAPPLQSESLPDPQRGSGASLPTLDMVPDCGLPPPASLLSSWVPPSQGAAWHSLTENSYCRFKPLSIC